MNPHKTACIAIILALATKRRVKRKRWMKEWLKKREQYSHILLLNEIRDTEPEDYKNYFRMNDMTFDKLLKLVTPFLLRKNTNMRQCLPVKERLVVTLRYLATGRNFEDLKLSSSSVSAAIIETCEVLMYVLQDYLKFPTTSEEWTEIAQEFGDRYQFWNTLGAIDGKHIAIKKPANSGSLYYNYKGFFSIVLLALVNAKKEFIMVDAGMNVEYQMVVFCTTLMVLFYKEIRAMRLERRIIRDSQNAFDIPNDQFMKLFRLTKELTIDLIENLSPYVPDPSRNTVISFHLKVLATLNFFGHGSFQGGIGSSGWNCMSQPMVSRSIKLVSRLITEHLMDDRIKFPTNNVAKTSIKEGFYNKWRMRGVIGVIDGCHIEILAPPVTNEDHPPFVYINRKGKHSVNTMIICDSNCKILAIDARYPGSVHDAAIFRTSPIRNLLRQEYDNGDVNSHLIGDSGFGVEPWLFTPFLHFQANSPEERFNILLKRNRNVVERTFGIMKKRFSCLSRHRVLLYHPSVAAYIIYAVAICHNIAQRANLDMLEHEQEIGNDEENMQQNDIQLIGEYADLGRVVRNEYILQNRV